MHHEPAPASELDRAIAHAESKVESAKHRRFAAEYSVDHNGSEAAIRAGYSKKAARQQAARLLTNANIRELVDAYDAKANAMASTDAERVRLELARVGFAKITDVVTWGDDQPLRVKPPHELSPAAAASVIEIHEDRSVVGYTEDGEPLTRIRRKVKLLPKTPALVKLAEMNGQLGPLAKHQGDETEVPGVIVVPARQSRDQWAKKHGVVEVDEHGNPVDRVN